MEIRLITKKNGRVKMNRQANENVTLEDVCYIAECEVNDGYADYACVKVDGEIYMEVES